MTRSLRSIAGHLTRAVFYGALATPRRCLAYLSDRRGRGRYRLLEAADLMATRCSDTVFIYGCGYSLNDITKQEWRLMEACNTISFREFPRQSFIRADYHVTGEVDFIEEYARRIRENRRYDDCIFVVQEGWSATAGNKLIGRGLLSDRASVYRYRRLSQGAIRPYSRSLDLGIVHGFGSVIGMTNFAYLMGWQRIVLTGVDLYDKRYFWLPPDEMRSYEKRGITIDSQFTSAQEIVNMIGGWAREMAREGVEVSCYNRRSLLAEVLPVFSWDAQAPTREPQDHEGGTTSRT